MRERLFWRVKCNRDMWARCESTQALAAVE